MNPVSLTRESLVKGPNITYRAANHFAATMPAATHPKDVFFGQAPMASKWPTRLLASIIMTLGLLGIGNAPANAAESGTTASCSNTSNIFPTLEANDCEQTTPTPDETEVQQNTVKTYAYTVDTFIEVLESDTVKELQFLSQEDAFAAILEDGSEVILKLPELVEDLQKIQKIVEEKELTTIFVESPSSSNGSSSSGGGALPSMYTIGGIVLFSMLIRRVIRKRQENKQAAAINNPEKTAQRRQEMLGLLGRTYPVAKNVEERFSDVAGHPEVVQDLQEVLEDFITATEPNKVSVFDQYIDNKMKRLIEKRVDSLERQLADKKVSAQDKAKAREELTYIHEHLTSGDIFELSWPNPKWTGAPDNIEAEENQGIEPFTSMTFNEPKKSVKPSSLTEMSASSISGLLLYGPPGTGKTLLARALAGESNSGFIYLSGSDFEEMLVGSGANNVRALWDQAKKVADEEGRCIIYIDEVDSIGGKRSESPLGGNESRTETLNQLFTKMDGFEKDSRILWVASTNRKDLLDPALIRPGRLEKHIKVDVPSGYKNRLAILDIYARPFLENGFIDDSVNLMKIAKMARGYSGADLKSLMTEAVRVAIKEGQEKITEASFAEAILRVTLGGRRKTSLDVPPLEHQRVLQHEFGHGAITQLTGGEVFIASSIPRGDALGFVVPSAENYSQYLPTRDEMLKRMLVSAGGRAAEEVLYGRNKVSAGWSSDLESILRQFDMMMSLGLLNGEVIAPTMPRKPTEQQQKFQNRFIEDELMSTARKLLSLVPKDDLEKMIKEFSGLERELIGDEANDFIKRHLENYPTEEGEALIEDFLENSFREE